MHTLKVQGVPDELYNRLTALARANQLSLNAQVIVLLNRVLEADAHQPNQAHLLAYIRQHRFAPPPAAPDSATIIREDRER